MPYAKLMHPSGQGPALSTCDAAGPKLPSLVDRGLELPCAGPTPPPVEAVLLEGKSLRLLTARVPNVYCVFERLSKPRGLLC